MEMKSMKNTSKGESDDSPVTMSDDDSYPYGLRLNIQDDQLQSLNIGNAKVGDEITIMAKTKVVSRSEYEDDKNNVDKSMSLQITDMGIHTEVDAGKRSERLYAKPS